MCYESLRSSLRFPTIVSDRFSFLLTRSAAAGDVELLKHFVAAGFDVNRTGFDQRTALHHAVSEARLATVQYLLTLPEIDVEVRDRWNRTALDEGEMNLGRAWERDSQRESDMREMVRMLRSASVKRRMMTGKVRFDGGIFQVSRTKQVT
jgi:ankyrin repeat protein